MRKFLLFLGLVALVGCPGPGPTPIQPPADSGSTLNDAVVATDVQSSCGVGQLRCAGLCTSIRSDNANCGGCGTACTGGRSCVNGTCVVPTTGPCSPTNLAGSCPSGQTCVSGACCASDRACGAQCCGTAAACVADASGNLSCAPRCNSSRDCTVGAATCCAVLYDEADNALTYGACLPFVAGETSCRCTTPAECQNGSCTPSLDASGLPEFPMICTTPGCGPYQHCTGLGSCGNGYCNLCDTAGNCYCAQVCTSAAMCGGDSCERFSRSVGSCASTQTACAPR